MRAPVGIAIYNVSSSAGAEDVIRSHVDRLERIYRRITTCRMRVDQCNRWVLG